MHVSQYILWSVRQCVSATSGPFIGQTVHWTVPLPSVCSHTVSGSGTADAEGHCIAVPNCHLNSVHSLCTRLASLVWGNINLPASRLSTHAHIALNTVHWLRGYGMHCSASQWPASAQSLCRTVNNRWTIGKSMLSWVFVTKHCALVLVIALRILQWVLPQCGPCHTGLAGEFTFVFYKRPTIQAIQSTELIHSNNNNNPKRHLFLTCFFRPSFARNFLSPGNFWSFLFQPKWTLYYFIFFSFSLLLYQVFQSRQKLLFVAPQWEWSGVTFKKLSLLITWEVCRQWERESTHTLNGAIWPETVLSRGPFRFK